MPPRPPRGPRRSSAGRSPAPTPRAPRTSAQPRPGTAATGGWARPPCPCPRAQNPRRGAHRPRGRTRRRRGGARTELRPGRRPPSRGGASTRASASRPTWGRPPSRRRSAPSSSACASAWSRGRSTTTSRAWSPRPPRPGRSARRAPTGTCGAGTSCGRPTARCSSTPPPRGPRRGGPGRPRCLRVPVPGAHHRRVPRGVPLGRRVARAHGPPPDAHHHGPLLPLRALLRARGHGHRPPLRLSPGRVARRKGRSRRRADGRHYERGRVSR